jgi:ABC-2 type transport system permease protein
MTGARTHELGWRVFWKSAYAVAWRHFHKWHSSPANLLPTVLFPTVFFVAFAGGVAAVENIPGFDYPPGYTTFQYAFVIFQAAGFGGLATGFSIAGDFGSGFHTRLMLTARHREAIVVGYMMSTLLRFLIIAAFITVLAALAGLSIQGSPVQFVIALLLACLLNLSGALWGIGVMMRGRSIDYAPLMQIPLFLTFFLAPVYMPLELLEGWIASVARYNPTTYLLEASRGLFAGAPEYLGEAAIGVLVLLALTAVWGIRGLRKAERTI